ncbi:MAG TPA: hypothetical protein VFA18_01750 [Gemmataceae bacterium]|nr:hypothetical protein [Gemmataceae bacterium]
MRGLQCVLGHLDARGDFIPDPKRLWTPLPEPGQGLRFRWLNVPQMPNETVYEFRCGILILGVLDKRGNFVPRTGSEPIDLNDYRPGNGAPRIYNLPGRLVKIGKGKGAIRHPSSGWLVRYCTPSFRRTG